MEEECRAGEWHRECRQASMGRTNTCFTSFAISQPLSAEMNSHRVYFSSLDLCSRPMTSRMTYSSFTWLANTHCTVFINHLFHLNAADFVFDFI